jgi:hypothetical protein
MQQHMFELAKHVREYHYDYFTVLNGIVADAQCKELRSRIDCLVSGWRWNLG